MMLRLSLGVALLLVASSASAEEPTRAETPSAEEPAGLKAARDEFKRGAGLAREQRWDQARLAFERSYQLRPHPVTTYNIAYCERAVGHPARALRAFERALAEHQARSGGELPPHLIELATTYRDEVARRVARVELVVPPGARVAIDGVSSTDVSSAVLLDPGAHVFVIAKPGFVTSAVTRSFVDGQRARLELPLEARPVQVERALTRGGIDRRWSYVAMGTGAAALVAAGVAGGLALRKRGQLEEACGAARSDCPENRRGDIESLGLYADTSTIAAIVGAAGLAVGAGLYFVAAPPAAGRDTSWAIGASGSF